MCPCRTQASPARPSPSRHRRNSSCRSLCSAPSPHMMSRISRSRYASTTASPAPPLAAVACRTARSHGRHWGFPSHGRIEEQVKLANSLGAQGRCSRGRAGRRGRGALRDPDELGVLELDSVKQIGSLRECPRALALSSAAPHRCALSCRTVLRRRRKRWSLCSPQRRGGGRGQRQFVVSVGGAL
jgi:hypothetical protein